MARMFTTFLRPVLALAAGSLIAVVCGEFVLSQTSLIDTPPGLFRRSETRAFEHRPGFTGRDINGNPIRINSSGLRDRDFQMEKPEGVYRVFVLGDSVAFGDGVAAEETFSKRLEEVLSARGLRVEVLNGGIRGYNTYQEAILLKEIGLRYRPDLVLLSYVGNDAEPFSRQQGLIGNPALRRVKDFLKEHSYLYAFFRKKIEVMRHRVTPQQFAETYDEHFKPDHPGWKASTAALREIRELSRSEGFEFTIAVFPRLIGLGENERYPYQMLHDQILGAGRDLGVDTFDLLAALKGRDEDALKITPGDYFHPNPAGHRLIAEKLADHLEARYLRGTAR